MFTVCLPVGLVVFQSVCCDSYRYCRCTVELPGQIEYPLSYRYRYIQYKYGTCTVPVRTVVSTYKYRYTGRGHVLSLFCTILVCTVVYSTSTVLVLVLSTVWGYNTVLSHTRTHTHTHTHTDSHTQTDIP